MRCYGDKKVRKMCFNHRHFRARLAEDAKGWQGSVPRDLHLPVNFRPHRFRFAEVIPRKSDFVQPHMSFSVHDWH